MPPAECQTIIFANFAAKAGKKREKEVCYRPAGIPEPLPSVVAPNLRNKVQAPGQANGSKSDVKDPISIPNVNRPRLAHRLAETCLVLDLVTRVRGETVSGKGAQQQENGQKLVHAIKVGYNLRAVKQMSSSARHAGPKGPPIPTFYRQCITNLISSDCFTA
jgi:hypothetical protein